MKPGEIAVLRRAEDLTTAWLELVLGTGSIERFPAEPIGTGQMSESHRVRIEFADGPDAGLASVVVKVAASDPTSRATGVGMGIYEREVRFLP